MDQGCVEPSSSAGVRLPENCRVDGSSEGAFEQFKYEVVVVFSVPKETGPQCEIGDGEEAGGVVSYLVEALESAGLEVQPLEGLNSKFFLKVAATDKVLGQAAEGLQLKKLTNLGLQTLFDWELRDSFVRQPHDKALFSWTERYYCLDFLIHGLKHNQPEGVHLKMSNPSRGDDCVLLSSGAPVIATLEDAGLVTDVFPLHDEKQRKDLLDQWSLNWFGGTAQPLDAIYSYFGPKIALYFAFLGMYTSWLLFPAVTGTLYFLVDFGTWSSVVPPISAVTMVVWAALFLQFWKRRNFGLLEKWELRLEEDEIHARKPWDSTEDESLLERHAQAPEDLSGKGIGIGPSAKKELGEEEWRDRVIIVRNIIIVFLAVVFFQIPFELLFASFNQNITSGFAKLVSIGGYLFSIQKFKVVGGKLAVRLNNSQAHISSEAAADSLIYKPVTGTHADGDSAIVSKHEGQDFVVLTFSELGLEYATNIATRVMMGSGDGLHQVFWIYFVQSYIGVFYHAFVLQNFDLLRQTLIQRMVVAQVMNNVMESLVPYLAYRFARRRTFKSERQEKQAVGEKVSDLHTSRVETEYLKPRYTTGIADQQYDGLFDDYLELALQFGIVVMFASSLPLVAVFSLLNNLVEIRSDSFKLLEMMKRPVPHMVGSIGAWMNIFQYLAGAAIVSNCILLIFMYDKGGKWRMDPGLAGVLILEHALLAARFGLSWFVPEVPAWVKAKRRKRRRLQEAYSLHVLRSLSNNTSQI